jgi:hypothetical protein
MFLGKDDFIDISDSDGEGHNEAAPKEHHDDPEEINIVSEVVNKDNGSKMRSTAAAGGEV